MVPIVSAGTDNPHTTCPRHVAILGDCIDVLPQLAHHSCDILDGPVDIVLIDPPYNTGAQRTYKDSYTAWYPWLQTRIAAALPLLADTAVIGVFIGPDELVRLRTLLDALLGAGNHLATIVWAGRGSPAAQFTAGGVDYLVVYARKRSALRGVRWREPHGPADELVALAADVARRDGTEAAEKAVAAWKKAHPDIPTGLGPYRHVDEDGRLWRAGPLAKPAGKRRGQFYDIVHPVTGGVCPAPDNGWRMTPEQLSEWDQDGQIVWPPDHSRAPRRRIWLNNSGGIPPAEVFHTERHLETRRLDKMLCGHRFDNPKDVEVLARWIKMWAGPQAVVLDFFAGSGSTGEAVMALNAADGGTRQAVLVTNDEVYEDVLVPRFVAVCDGVRPDGSAWPGKIEGASISFVRDLGKTA